MWQVTPKVKNELENHKRKPLNQDIKDELTETDRMDFFLAKNGLDFEKFEELEQHVS